MEYKFLLPMLEVQKQNAIQAIYKCNENTSQFGLQLTTTQINELVQYQYETLKNAGRIELGESIIPKLISEFYDSKYISQYNYLEILKELQEIFYYFKNESLDKLSDDELICGMKKYFDGVCQGSLDLLKSTYLEKMCQNVRFNLDLHNDDGDDEQCLI